MSDTTPIAGLWADSEAWSVAEPTESTRAGDLDLLRKSGLVDGDYYCSTYPDIAASGVDPAEHFLIQGWREARLPNPYFDTAWYLRQNRGVAQAAMNPLTHYIRRGEAENCSPAAYFDLPWYRSKHAEPSRTWLRHFLDRRFTGRVSPLPEFDPVFYLQQNPDIAAAGVDPFEHYLHYGYREGRDPSCGFQTRFYLRRYLDGQTSQNPLLHYRAFRGILRLHTAPTATDASVFEDVRTFTSAGPAFEEFQPLPASAPRRANLLAYYLPQFHSVPENDRWWGRGFTEWTSVARGMPRFAGHYQPRTPRDLGYYTLDDAETMRRQIALARGAGLHAFVHYFYWFNGQRLLEKPIEAMLADPALDFPFALMWANENWTRRWDGSDDEVLIAQDYRESDDAALIDTFARHFSDPRYIRVDGRPILMIYRPRLIPDTQATVARWRHLFADRHDMNPLLVMAQSFADTDPRPFAFDGAIEFPPHKLVAGLRTRNREISFFDLRATAQVFAYDDVVATSLAEPTGSYPLIKTAMPGWDNDARRQGAGMVLHGSTPAKYQAWMEQLIDRAQAQPFFGETFVCVNAWNEWAEGAYLEPDVHFGAAYLNATARAVSRGAAKIGTGLLLVGHDAFPAGAQQLLLHLGRRLRRVCGVRVEFLLLGDGALAVDFADTAPTTIIKDRAIKDSAGVAQHLAAARARGIAAAIVNTAAAAWIVPPLRQAGIAATMLVHEMTRLIEEKGLLAGARAGAALSHRVVFAAAPVRDSFAGRVPLDPDRAAVLPQGLYRPVAFDPVARNRLRRRLGIDDGTRLVVGAGYADLRKGFDLFLRAWRVTRRRAVSAAFCWIGDADPTLRAYLGQEIEAAVATGSFHFPGWQDDVSEWFSAADLFALTSREDPFPSVVLEALSAGLPTVAFADSGGIPDLLREHRCGITAPMADAEAMADLIVNFTKRPKRFGSRDRLAALARSHFDFTDYARALLREAQPDLADISVAVLSYNYAHYLDVRLASVFAQTHPVCEVMVLDDASSDQSADVAQRVAAEWNRDIELDVNQTTSGSVVAQWRRAAQRCAGQYLWIAEADDAAEPAFLQTLAGRLQAAPDAAFAFCDSRSIDRAGAEVSPSYKDYYVLSDAAALQHDGLFAAETFFGGSWPSATWCST